MAVFRVEKTKNYTVMSNNVLRDKRLSLKAKGLMSLMLSLPDNWDYTTRGLAAICKESKDTISKIVNELVAVGYIVREQERRPSGKLGKITYAIYEAPRSVKVSGTPPCPKKPATVKPCPEKPCLDNLPQLSTIESNTDVIKYPSNQSAEPTTDTIDVDMIEHYRKIIHENIDYDVTILNEPGDKEFIDEIVEVMLECVTASGAIRIGCYEYSCEVVKSRMLKIDSSHIEYILHALSKSTTKIRNMKAYLRTTIYNAPTTINSFYRAEVNHDFG
jgi:hypothetical protein